MFEILSNTSHVHLLLNHVPTTAFVVALVLFVVSLFNGSEALKKAGLAMFFLIAAVTIATYTSGSAAEAWLRGTSVKSELPPDVVSTAIHEHEDAALWAMALMEVTGFFSWLALWQWKTVRRLPSWNTPLVLVLAALSFVAMSRTAYLGGHITHVEIRPEVVERHQACLALVDQEVKHPGSVPNAPENCPWQAAVDQVVGTGPTAAAAPAPNLARQLGDFVIGHTWMWPTLETLHFVGLCMLFTAVIIVNLRLLGAIPMVPVSAVYQMLPIGMLGFAVNLLTGMLFFVGIPSQYNANPVFYWKMVFVLLGGVNVTYFMLVDDAWRTEPGRRVSAGPKIAAASAIFIWAAVLYCGHMLPFIGNAF
ncbi:MAG TPA: hypothetical protein VLV86_20790 [Vicinamibacterales bacterium]|nr:hypothetical protein [Vicinamibacterales bacterium]